MAASTAHSSCGVAVAANAAMAGAALEAEFAQWLAERPAVQEANTLCLLDVSGATGGALPVRGWRGADWDGRPPLPCPGLQMGARKGGVHAATLLVDGHREVTLLCGPGECVACLSLSASRSLALR